MKAEELSVVVLPPASVVSASLGPMLTGIMIEHLLLGIVCYQATTYFHYHFCGDGRFIRSIVASLVVLNICLGVINFVAIHRITILYFGNFDQFDVQGWTSWIEPGVTALVALIAHIFYIARCWTMMRSLPFVIFLAFVALLAFAFGITYVPSYVHIVSCIGIRFCTLRNRASVISFVLGRISKISGAMVPGTVWLASTAVCDISIAASLVFHFWRTSNSGAILRSTHMMLLRLQRTTIETGSLTAICAILNLILFAILAPSGYYLLLQYSMSHLYTLSVLYTLLGRQDLRDILSTGTGTLITGFTHASSPSPGLQFSYQSLQKKDTMPRNARNMPVGDPGDHRHEFIQADDANSIAMHRTRNNSDELFSDTDLETKLHLPRMI